MTTHFPFINFCGCYRLQMPDMSPFLTASIMKIMLQAGNVRSSSLPALTHPHSVLLSFSCLHAFQVRGRATMADCPMPLTKEKNYPEILTTCILKEMLCFLICRFSKNTVISGHTTGRVELNSSSPFWGIVWVKIDMHAKILKMLTYSYTLRTWVTFWSS